MKQHTIAHIPSFSIVVTFIAVATKCEALQSTNGSNNIVNTDSNDNICDKRCQTQWLIDQINVFLVELPCVLLFTFVFACYVCIQAEQRLHGWMVLAITGSLGLRFGVVVLTNLPQVYLGWEYEIHLHEICLTLGVLHHLFFFMCYCWSLVLAFDLWRRVRTMTQRTSADSETRRFVAYSAFGFGFPLFNVVLAVILEWGVSDSARIWKPMYFQRCRIWDSYDYYIGIPNGILLVTNLTLLAAAYYSLWRAKKGTAVLGGTGGVVQKNLAGLIVKIFVLMGGLMIADFGIHYTGIYKVNLYLRIPVEFICRVGYALGFVWVFVFTGNAKGHLRRKYPGIFGKVFNARGKLSMSATRNTNTAKTATTVV